MQHPDSSSGTPLLSSSRESYQQSQQLPLPFYQGCCLQGSLCLLWQEIFWWAICFTDPSVLGQPSVQTHFLCSSLFICSNWFQYIPYTQWIQKTQLHSLILVSRNTLIVSNKYNLRELKQTWEFITRYLKYLTEELNSKGMERAEIWIGRQEPVTSTELALSRSCFHDSLLSLQIMFLSIELEIKPLTASTFKCSSSF